MKILTKKLFLIVILLLCAVGVGFWYKQLNKQEIEYMTQTVKKKDIRQTIQATGTLKAVETVDVGTQISGTIKDIYIDYNSVLKKGQLIAEIESLTQQADVGMANANLKAAYAELDNSKAVLENAKKNFARTKELADRDLIAKTDVDKDEKFLFVAHAQVNASKAKIEQSAAALAKAKVNMGYTKIYSPVDGVVVAKNVEKGQTVAASYQTPSIAEIAKDLEQMQVEVNVDEADIGGVKEGQEAVFYVDAHPSVEFRGSVTQVRLSPIVSNSIVTYTVIVKVKNEKHLLMPGMTANVSLMMQERKAVLSVPNSAFRFKPVDLKAAASNQGGPGPGMMKSNIAEDAAKPCVYLAGHKNTPVKTEVVKGITDGETTEVISGLLEGDKVITGIVVKKEEK